MLIYFQQNYVFVVVFSKITLCSINVITLYSWPKYHIFHRNTWFLCQLSSVKTHFSLLEKTKSPCYGGPKSCKHLKNAFFHWKWSTKLGVCSRVFKNCIFSKNNIVLYSWPKNHIFSQTFTFFVSAEQGKHTFFGFWKKLNHPATVTLNPPKIHKNVFSQEVFFPWVLMFCRCYQLFSCLQNA